MRVLLIFILALVSLPVIACSPRHINTPQELIQLADGIYRVQATSFVSGPNPSLLGPAPRPSSQIKFVVIGTIKGPRQSTVQVPGMLSEHDDLNTRPVPYDFVRSEGASGGCFASSFRIGNEYLLFMRNGTPYWAPLAATTEQIVGAQDPWLIWVKAHLKLHDARPNNSFKPKPLRGSA